MALEASLVIIDSLFCGVKEYSFSVELKLALREEVRIQRSGAILGGSGSGSG